MLRSSALLVVSSLMTVTDAKWSFGSCPEYKMMANFDKYRYVGKWYQIVRDYSVWFTPWVQCMTMEFSPVRDDGSFEQNYRGLFWPILTYVNNDGVYYQCGEDPTLSWTCQATMQGGTIRGDIHIFDTDYDNYKILYGCEDMLGGLMKSESFGLFGRDPTMSDSAMEIAKKNVKEKTPNYDLDSNWWNLEWVQHNGICDYESGWKFY